MKKISTIIFIFILFFMGCKKNPSTENVTPPAGIPLIELGPNTVIVDNSTGQIIQSIDSTHVIFNGNTEQLQKFATGNIIVSGITTNAPEGFLRKISSIIKSGTLYNILTTEVTLTEAFKNLHIDFTTSAPSFTITSPEVILYDVDGNNNTSFDQLKVSVNSGLLPKFHIKVDINNFTLEYAKLDGNFEGTLNTLITSGGSIGSVSKKINIYSQPIGLFTIPGTPIVIAAVLRVSLGASGSINIEIVASDTKTTNVNSYIEYKSNNWDKGYVKTMDNQFVFSGLNGIASAKIYVEPAIDFKLWGSNWAKGSITTQGYIKATGQLLPTPDCELKAGISAGAEANLTFFGWTFASASYPDIFDFSKILFTCSTPNTQLPTVSTTSVSNTTNTSALSGGNVTNVGSSPVTVRGVCWGTSLHPTTTNSFSTNGNGLGVFTSSLTTLSPNTTYYLRAYATNSQGTNYGNEIIFTTQSVATTIPVVSTSIITTITPTTAQSGGTITSDGGASISARGVCWSVSQNPTILNNKTTNGIGVGNFNSSLTSLTPNTLYYIRAYATNSLGTGYGNQLSFTTSTGIVTDIDGNVYNTVTIGSQVWMVENLKVTRYRNGDLIPNVSDGGQWYALSQSGAYCNYNNDASNNTTYGRLYNWWATSDTRLIAPSGWHVPTETDWTLLENFLGGAAIAGGKMKEMGTSHWLTPNVGATNSSGFYGLPGGTRGSTGSFGGINTNGIWWTSTIWPSFGIYYHSLRYAAEDSYSTYTAERNGLSIRCIKD